MINITIDATTGDEARKALLELLGLTGAPSVATITGENLKAGFKDWGEAAEAVKEQLDDQNRLEATRTEQPKKRRSKAEIEAEKNASATAAEQPDDEPATAESQEQAETPAEEATSTVTKEDLQKKAVELGRVGKKELCRTVLQKHGADSISTADKNPLKVELYATVLDEFNKL